MSSGEAPGPGETPAAGATPAGPVPARILLIEDDLPLAHIVAKHLRARGHDAQIAASAEEAAEQIADGFRPTLVLLDINLPGDSGWAFLRSGALEAAGKPPVFVVSATTVPPSRLREFGCAGYLPKPFAVSTLIEIVERHPSVAGDDADSDADGAEISVPQGDFDAF
jgi:DNA-binding response OmpR family regulator